MHNEFICKHDMCKYYSLFSFPGILKVPPINQMLFNKDNQMMVEDKTLQDYGLTSSTAKAQSPAPIGLALRYEFIMM